MVRRSALGVVPLLVAAVMVPSSTLAMPYDTNVYRCAAEDMAYLIAQGPAAFGSDSWIHCQFRLYDDNGGRPHVFTTDEYFLGGVFVWLTEKDLGKLGLTRDEGIALLRAASSTVFWGPGDKKATLSPLATEATPYADFDSGKHILTYNFQYHVFEPGSVEPGSYRWRWDYDGALGKWSLGGEVVIVAP